LSSETNFTQRVSVTINFTITRKTQSEEPEEAVDLIAASIEPMMEELRLLYQDVEVSAESEVIEN
jgi:hypothetical protein